METGRPQNTYVCGWQRTVCHGSGMDLKVVSNFLSNNLNTCNAWLIDQFSLHQSKIIVFVTKNKLSKLTDFSERYKTTNISNVNHLVIKLELNSDTDKRDGGRRQPK